MEDTIGNTFKLIKKLGSGAFAAIVQGINIKTNIEVAVKIAPLNSDPPQLYFESKLYEYFHTDSSAKDKGIPYIHYFGREDDYLVLVMDLLGPNLEELFNICNRKFSLKTVLMLADQMLTRLEYIHSRKFIHRDIKPENFVMGTGERSHMVYIIDFGLARRVIHENGKHIRDRHWRFMGTPRYASVNNHFGKEQSRRDDLESLGYVLIYFLRGSLPWQNILAFDKNDKYNEIMKSKVHTAVQDLCKGFPTEFATYIDYCRRLYFDDEPDYSYLKNMFKDLFIKSGFEYDYMYDWVIISKEKKDKDKMDELAADLQKNEKSNPLGENPANANEENINNMAVNSNQIKKDENPEENKPNDKANVLF